MFEQPTSSTTRRLPVSNIIPVDLPNLFLAEIEKGQRPEDGLLHSSGDLVGSLRHTQLRIAGVPKVRRTIASYIRLAHGTLWHDWFHGVLDRSGIPFKSEIKLNEWMPEGWGGTADWLIWNPEYEAWCLSDLKTTKGESIFWIQRDGAKKEHIWQVSSYWHALAASGIPLVKGFAVMYWPMNETSDSVDVQPTVIECEPIPADVIIPVMEDRKARVDAYLAGAEELAPEMEREQKYTWNKATRVFDLKLVPHWSTRFCEYSEEYCTCKNQGTTKIGHFQTDGEYIPRSGYEAYEPSMYPTEAEFDRRVNEN
jgi:hypothetical protein